MKSFLLLFPVLFWLPLHGQILPSQRAANWQQAGCMEVYPENPVLINAFEYGILPDGVSDNSEALQQVIAALNGTPGVIYFPEGHYHFAQPIHLASNVIIRGASANSTAFTFKLDEEKHLIYITGSKVEENIHLAADGLKADQQLSLTNTESLSAGDYVYLFEDDHNLVHNDWAAYSTGQICRIESIQDSTVQLHQLLRRTFHTGKQARIVRINPVSQVGIEHLRLERLDATQSQTSNIFFEYAADCWINCIESYNCNFAHVELKSSTNVEVRGSYFKDAFGYGNGGKAYGVMLHFGTGECLIENNVFNHLRHAMILQAGANGNVLAYNYSVNPYWTGVQLPSNAAGDLVLHGNYPYSNLMEGNIIQNIVIDNSHGVNGPYNTFFRNRAELYGIFMNNNPASHSQNFIANEISNPGFLLGLYFIVGEDHFELGNNALGNILPTFVNNLEEHSLYLEESPDFFPPVYPWPAIGIPNDLEANMIPAKDRFQQGFFTSCAVQVITKTDEIAASDLRVYPNPVSDLLNVETAEPIEEMKLFRTNGQLMWVVRNADQINMEAFEKGVYSLLIRLANEEGVVRKIVKH